MKTLVSQQYPEILSLYSSEDYFLGRVKADLLGVQFF